MLKSSQARVASLVLALGVLVGSALLIERGLQTPTNSVKSPAPSSPESPKSPDQRRPHDTPPSAAHPTSTGAAIYQCERDGRRAFRDTPCAEGEKHINTTVNTPLPPIDERQRLDKMRDTATLLETARRERERKQAEAMSARADSPPSVSAKPKRCLLIDEEIKRIDALLRQYHSAQEGDRLTGRRKELTDERFSRAC